MITLLKETKKDFAKTMFNYLFFFLFFGGLLFSVYYTGKKVDNNITTTVIHNLKDFGYYGNCNFKSCKKMKDNFFEVNVLNSNAFSLSPKKLAACQIKQSDEVLKPFIDLPPGN